MAKKIDNIAKFKRFYAQCKQLKSDIESGVARNIKDACDVMLLKAKESTPPCKGERRGTEAWTGQLRRHWEYKIIPSNAQTTVVLYNDMQYASYVENGHRMVKHFVPWLFIDDTGVISRHKPVSGEKMFGLWVGTKTTYVEGAGMIPKAVDAFNTALTYMNNSLMTDLQRKHG